MKTLVFKIAHSTRSNFATFGQALKHAWQVAKLKYRMLNGVVEFTFKKVDGSIRNAVGTLQNQFVNYEIKGGNKSSLGVMAYFDVEQNGFRCFKIQNLVY